MKPLLSLMLLVLLPSPWAWGLAAGGQVPEVLRRSCCDAASRNAAGPSPGVSEGKRALGSGQAAPAPGAAPCLLPSPAPLCVAPTG